MQWEHMFLLEFSSLMQRNPLFQPFVWYQAMRSGSLWFTWLKCSNHFALLLQCNHCLEMFLFFLVSQAFTIMLAKRGTVFVRGCIGYHFDGLLSTFSCPTSFSFVYCYVINHRGHWLWLSRGGCNRVYCMCSGPWPFKLFFLVLFLFDWVGVLWPQLSKVLKLVRWAHHVLFPPVSLQ